jgi:hypothetical protein
LLWYEKNEHDETPVLAVVERRLGMPVPARVWRRGIDARGGWQRRERRWDDQQHHDRYEQWGGIECQYERGDHEWFADHLREQRYYRHHLVDHGRRRRDEHGRQRRNHLGHGHDG